MRSGKEPFFPMDQTMSLSSTHLSLILVYKNPGSNIAYITLSVFYFGSRYVSTKLIHTLSQDNCSEKTVFSQYVHEYWGFLLYPWIVALGEILLDTVEYDRLFSGLLFASIISYTYYKSLVFEYTRINTDVYKKGSLGYSVYTQIEFLLYYLSCLLIFSRSL